MGKRFRRFGAALLSLTIVFTFSMGIDTKVTAENTTSIPAVLTGPEVIENFSEPLTLTNGTRFGKNNSLTYMSSGAASADNSSLKYLNAAAPNKEDIFAIASSRPLPKTYKVSVDLGNINSAGKKVGSNGFELLDIMNGFPSFEQGAIETGRKIAINNDNTDSNVTVYGAYFSDKHTFHTYNSSNDQWSSWDPIALCSADLWYTFQVEKTDVNYIFSLFDTASATLIESFTIPISSVMGPSLPDYLVIGDLFDYHGSGDMKIANICVQSTTIDTTAPSKPEVSQVSNKSDTVSGKVEAGAFVEVTLESSLIGTAMADEQGNFEVKIGAQKEGSVFLVSAFDEAGNMSEASSVTLTDAIAPLAPKVNTVKSTSKAVTGKAEAGSTVVVKVGTKELSSSVADSEGNFLVSIKAQKEGTVLLVNSIDVAGNIGTAATVTVADCTAPAIPIVNKVKSSSKTVTGKAEVGSTVIVKKGTHKLGSAKASKGGTFSVKIAKQKAGTKLLVTAADSAKNVSKAKVVTVVK
jgi:hypothetical protein